MSASLYSELQSCAAQSGLNLCGLVDAERFDRCQPPDWRVRRLLPECGTVVVLGSGGRQFWQQLVARHGCRLAPGQNPLQEHTLRCAEKVLGRLDGQLRPARLVLPEDRESLNFVQLAEAAGFGIVSPVTHVLLHPKFGNWVSLRAALLLPGHPFGALDDASVSSTWAPCSNCPRPCVSACPAGVRDGVGGADHQRCVAHRQDGDCEVSCGVRRACPVGREHRYSEEEEAMRQACSLMASRRGAWLQWLRFVPRFFRMR